MVKDLFSIAGKVPVVKGSRGRGVKGKNLSNPGTLEPLNPRTLYLYDSV